MTRAKRDEAERPVLDLCRILGRCCVVAILICLVWGLVYMPLKTGSHMRIPGKLSWMVTQRDLTQFVFPENDTTLLTPDIHSNESLLALVVVCSSVPNALARNAIRSTWAQDTQSLKNVRVIFLVGKSSNESLNVAIVQESKEHKDIIQQDFLDTYNNLTVKSVMLLKWICQKSVATKYVMKTDDDMFVHLPNLVKLLQEKGHEKLLTGCLIKGAVPVKDWSSKWFVPDMIFPDRVYPPYLSGTGYVMSRGIIPVLYDTALNTPFFYLEDVFITGVCSRRAGLKPENNNGFKFYKRKNNTCTFRSLITAHKMSVKELFSIWNEIHNPSVKCKS